MLIVEVTSPAPNVATAARKLEHYQRIASLQAVLIVAHAERKLELWTRDGGGWQSRVAGPGQRLDLSAIGASLDVQQVYVRAGVT
jgi:Uma2 family endonuclease